MSFYLKPTFLDCSNEMETKAVQRCGLGAANAFLFPFLCFICVLYFPLGQC